MPDISTQTGEGEEDDEFKILSDEEVAKLKKWPKIYYLRKLKKYLKQQELDKLLLEREIKHQKAIENKKIYMRNYMKNYNKMKYKYDPNFRNKIKDRMIINYYFKELNDANLKSSLDDFLPEKKGSRAFSSDT